MYSLSPHFVASVLNSQKGPKLRLRLQLWLIYEHFRQPSNFLFYQTVLLGTLKITFFILEQSNHDFFNKISSRLQNGKEPKPEPKFLIMAPAPGCNSISAPRHSSLVSLNINKLEYAGPVRTSGTPVPQGVLGLHSKDCTFSLILLT
jgi:hypothetical protein